LERFTMMQMEKARHIREKTVMEKTYGNRI
jgi:hypothetical protein